MEIITGDFYRFESLHAPQLQASGVPKHLWRSLYVKLITNNFDAGKVLELNRIEYDDSGSDIVDDGSNTRPEYALLVTREDGLTAEDTDAIFLIDHAWTFRLPNAREQLLKHKNLLDHMCEISGVHLNEDDDCRVVKVMRRLWKYCNFYTISNENQPIWYVMDKVGSAVCHAEDPNCRLVPFLFLDSQETYSLLFPIKDCEYGELITRDYAEHISKDAIERRQALLLPWHYTDMKGISFVQTEPNAEYFSSGHIPETHPSEDNLMTPLISRDEPLKVYAEYSVVKQYLTSSYFALVDDVEQADILWLTKHFKDFADLAYNTPNKFINQFPFEYVISIKDLLSIISRRAAVEHHNAETLTTYPIWLPTTYNLKTELPQFASYFQSRTARGLDNHWIVKPWNLARGLDMHVTNNLAQIVRLSETGPKIAQKYIERPVLFYRSDIQAPVKFDVRYVILLKSVKPLEAYIHRNFYLRFANKAFSLDHLDDYEKHFTVMNYQTEVDLHHLKCEDFLPLWQQQNPENPWHKQEDKICQMLYEILECATKSPPPCGIAACLQSRALYAADIMLEDCSTDGERERKMQPKILEINWTPDCKRACDYYPEFFNDIFKLLFLNETNNEVFRPLKKTDKFCT
uniref:Tubulin--tyrosine ligase-like protein 12 SET-like domain-containing protein n=1 Tax=Glossina pallidipes TaxID=7398 RepID=A0A1A9Z5I3_GLOPL